MGSPGSRHLVGADEVGAKSVTAVNAIFRIEQHLYSLGLVVLEIPARGPAMQGHAPASILSSATERCSARTSGATMQMLWVLFLCAVTNELLAPSVRASRHCSNALKVIRPHRNSTGLIVDIPSHSRTAPHACTLATSLLLDAPMRIAFIGTSNEKNGECQERRDGNDRPIHAFNVVLIQSILGRHLPDSLSDAQNNNIFQSVQCCRSMERPQELRPHRHPTLRGNNETSSQRIPKRSPSVDMNTSNPTANLDSMLTRTNTSNNVALCCHRINLQSARSCGMTAFLTTQGFGPTRVSHEVATRVERAT
jgi:hypothetical protein